MSNARRNYRRSCLLAAGMLFLAGPLAAQIQTSPLAGKDGTALVIAQTSSGGSNTHLIDPVTNKVIGIIEGLGLPHGITVNPEGTKYYVTNEHDISVDVVDARLATVQRELRPWFARCGSSRSGSLPDLTETVGGGSRVPSLVERTYRKEVETRMVCPPIPS